MRVRVCFHALIAALTLWALAPGAASAQMQPMPQRQQFDSRPLQVFGVLVGAQPQATMELRFRAGRTGYVAGAFMGDRLEGYHYVSTNRNTLALIRYNSANVAVQLFTADYDAAQRSWIGYAHGLAGAAGTMQNAVGFRTVPQLPVRCSRLSRVPCPPPPVAPAAPHATTAYNWNAVAIGYGINANNFLGPLVLRSDPTTLGAFAGHALGDPIRGRYVVNTGTIAFLRFEAGGAPMQAWIGVMEASGAKSGRGYPLSPSGADPFSWRVTHDDHAIVGIRSPTGNNRCLTQGPAFTGACAREWLLFAVGSATGLGAQTWFSLAHVTGGLCLDVPEVPDGLVVERSCIAGAAGDNDVGQELFLSNWVVAGDGELDFDSAINTTAAFEQSSNLHLARVGSGFFGRCIAVQGSTGSITSGECDSSRANWARLP